MSILRSRSATRRFGNRSTGEQLTLKVVNPLQFLSITVPASSPRPTSRVDDLDVPAEERTFMSRLQVLGPGYEIEITLREEELIPRAVEHIRVFLVDHSAAGGAVGGYLLRMLGDIFKDWAKDRLKRAPKNTEELIIYGADGKPAKTIVVTTGAIRE